MTGAGNEIRKERSDGIASKERASRNSDIQGYERKEKRAEKRKRSRNKRFLILLRFDRRSYDRSGKGDSEGAKRRNSEQKSERHEIRTFEDKSERRREQRKEKELETRGF